ncbi:hypothetical protein [Sinomonas soli]
MSHDQHFSHQPAGPQAGAWPSTAALSPEDAEKSRRWRVILGSTALLLALFSGFYAYTNIASVVRATAAVEAAGGFVPQTAMALAVAIIGVFCFLALAYAGVGAWNVAARRSTSKAPLIAAVVLAATACILIVFYMATRGTGGFQLGGLALNVLILARAATILRMKKSPAHQAAAHWTT